MYVFTEPAGGWASASSDAKLTASTPQENAALGSSVAISGNTVIAGAPGALTGSSSANTGAVYLYNKPAAGWASETESGQLADPGATANDSFGFAVAASGGTLVVGAPLALSFSGVSYVYSEPAGGWASENPTATLTTSAGGINAVGWSVAISGGTIVAGAPLSSVGSGVLDVYSEPAGGWANAAQTVLLDPPGGSTSFLGQSVSVWGDTIAAGATGVNNESGAVYVYQRPASGDWSTWSAGAAPTATLTASNGAANDELGFSVVISGTTIVAGAPNAQIGSNPQQGAAYVYTGSGANWSQSAILTDSGGGASESFGTGAAVSGTALAVGGNGATINGQGSQGAALVFGGLTDSGSDGTTTTTSSASTTTTSTTATATTAATGGVGAFSSSPHPGAARSYATVTAIGGGPALVTVSLKCTATTGKCTAANVLLQLQERFSGNRLVGTLASVRYKRVVVGAGHVTLAAGAHATLQVHLNALGRSLLGSQARMTTGVSVTSVGRTLRLDTVVVTQPVRGSRRR